MEITAGFILGLFAVLVVLIVGVNPFITWLIVERLRNPNVVWNGEFEIILDDDGIISGSFQNKYGVNGIDIPKGRRIKYIRIKSVPRGFVPMLFTTELETRLAMELIDFSTDTRTTDLYFKVICPERLPELFSLAVASDRKIANGEERSVKGLFFPKHDINIWFSRPGVE